MENASKALLIAGAILISILIIAIGMYIYSTSQGSINNAMTQMDTQEIEAFNKEWSIYDGRMTGSQVKALIGKLIANVETYRDENVKIIDLYCEPTPTAGQNVTAQFNHDQPNEAAFVGLLNTAYSRVQAKHTYNVIISYNTNGLIDGINVNYEVTGNNAETIVVGAMAAGGANNNNQQQGGGQQQGGN